MTISQTPEGLPDKNVTNASVETSLESLEIFRQFQEIDHETGTNIVRIWSGQSGKYVKITIKNLNNFEKGILSKVCDFIEEKLSGTEEYKESISTLIKVTLFCVTNSKHLLGYSGLLHNQPIVIFNSETITGSNDEEFAIAVLHELLHFMIIKGDADSTSLEEAEHDLLCYGLLDLPVPINHWAIHKYPHLLEQKMSNTIETEGELK